MTESVGNAETLSAAGMGGWGGQGDLQTFGGQKRCWKCAKKTVNYSKNCSLGRITRSQVAASRNMPQDRPTQSQDGPT